MNRRDPKTLDASQPDGYGLPISARVLKWAREQGAVNVRVAVVYLGLPNGGEVAAHFAPEYGDGDGTALMNNFVRECREGDLLEPGETLRVEVKDVP